jgi:hypothetical protein
MKRRRKRCLFCGKLKPRTELKRIRPNRPELECRRNCTPCGDYDYMPLGGVWLTPTGRPEHD